MLWFYRDTFGCRKSIDPQLREQFAAAIERHRREILAERKDTFKPQNKKSIFNHH